MKIMPFLSILLACAGCMSQKTIDRVLTELPPHMRENIGPVKFEPLSPLSLFFAGQVIETDPSATIHLYAFADEDVLKHEAFHSFELLSMYERPLEWQKYCLCMGNTDTKIAGHLAFLLPVPPQWLPSDSSGTVYGETDHFEEGAEVFVHHQPERKWDCVCRFTHGISQNRSHLMQKIARRGSADWSVSSILRRNFHAQASLNRRQTIANKEPAATSTILSIIRRYFLDQTLSYHSPPIVTKEPPTDPTVLSTIRHYFLDQDVSQSTTAGPSADDFVREQDVEAGGSK